MSTASILYNASTVKIYTKTGDQGRTSLFGGKRVIKDDLRIDAYGNVDELNSLIGVIIAESGNKEVVKKLTRVQAELMVLGSDLSSPLELRLNTPRVTKVFIARLEREIDNWVKQLPKLKNFILPGGSATSARLHFARSVTRRAERTFARLAKSDNINKFAVIYINRLSDWLFVLARYVNMKDGSKEIIWKGRGR